MNPTDLFRNLVANGTVQDDDELTAELLRERSIEDANDQRDDTHDAEYREEKARAMRRAKDMREGGVSEEEE